MRAEIISVGTELLLGDIVDTNAVTLSKELNAIGIDVYYRTTVGDNEERIVEVVAQALKRVDVVLITGGLGPTVDDVTREAVARATGRGLVFHPHLLDTIEERFRRYGTRMTNNNRRQAYIPEGAIPINNPVGTAPIFILAVEQGTVIVMPGVPKEMEFLLENHVLPWLKAHDDSGLVLTTKVLRTAGIGESSLDDTIADLMRMRNPSVALTAKVGQTDIRITAKARSKAEAEQLIRPIEEDLRARLGDTIYGEDNQAIEQVINALSEEDGLSIGIIEAGSGGILSIRLGIHGENCVSIADLAHFDVDVTAALDTIAIEAAAAIRKREKTDVGISLVMRSDSDETGAQGAYAVTSSTYTNVREFHWPRRREDSAVWTSTWAMAMLRHALLAQRAGQ